MRFILSALTISLLCWTTPLSGQEEEWALTVRTKDDGAAHLHKKIELDDGTLTLTDLQSREEVALDSNPADIEAIRALIEKYIHQTRLAVSQDDLDEFIEVEFEYETENKSIELEFTFAPAELPADIKAAIDKYMR